MSWEIFKQNVQRKLCDASKVPSIEYVAEVYATEYDLCMKRGGTIPDRIPIVKGNVEGMKRMFIQALKTGLTYTESYDLTGAMGEGVKIYWTGATMATPIPPIITVEQLATGAVTNITANTNTCTNSGQWTNTNTPVSNPKPYNTNPNVDSDDSDVVNDKVDDKQTDTTKKDMPPITADFNLHKIPGNYNNYRSAQIPVRFNEDGSIEGPYPEIIKKYGIKTIIRMNGDGSDGRKTSKWPITTIATEKAMCEKLGCEFYYINAHGAIEPGNGYQVTNKKIVEIMKKGNVLIHCAHGADRTGGHVGGFLKKMGIMTNNDQIWDYTITKNNWMSYIKNKKFFGSGYDKYANIFYPEDLLKDKFNNASFNKENESPKEEPKNNSNKKILIVGDSITVDSKYTWSGIYKAQKKDLNVEILAKGGEQLTAWMKPQLEARLKTNKYDKVYIYGGVNDCYAGKKTSTILGALQSMVNTVRASGAEVIVITGYDAEIDMGDNSTKPTKYVKTKAEMEKFLTEYRTFQKSINTIQNAKIVPKTSIGVIGDGFHPSYSQARKLYEHISKY